MVAFDLKHLQLLLGASNIQLTSGSPRSMSHVPQGWLLQNWPGQAEGGESGGGAPGPCGHGLWGRGPLPEL